MGVVCRVVRPVFFVGRSVCWGLVAAACLGTPGPVWAGQGGAVTDRAVASGGSRSPEGLSRRSGRAEGIGAVGGVVETAGTHVPHRAAIRIGDRTVVTDTRGRFRLDGLAAGDSLEVVLLDDDGNPTGFVRTIMIEDAPASDLVIRVVPLPPGIEDMGLDVAFEFLSETLLDGPVNPRTGPGRWKKWRWANGPPTITIVRRNANGDVRFDDDTTRRLREVLEGGDMSGALMDARRWTVEVHEDGDGMEWETGPAGDIAYAPEHIVIIPKHGRPSNAGAWDRDGDGRIEGGFINLAADTGYSTASAFEGTVIHELMHAMGAGHAPDSFFGITIMRGLVFTETDRWLTRIMREETFGEGEPAGRIFGVQWSGS